MIVPAVSAVLAEHQRVVVVHHGEPYYGGHHGHPYYDGDHPRGLPYGYRNGDGYRGPMASCMQLCSTLYDPVCGSNGITYRNVCVMNCQYVCV